ncbi:2-iminobutanoate/2-iminopropanoate deaminase [Microcoleus sp. IPMA8]|uniref:2-iminobutanoate/2-iminopropanoate deaminase n=2 Tax=Microcoleus TaxID=44471 RepID=A0ABX2D4A9_9CYAN|nr:2-iminobutanoate/2-iminopropanoate deaminase [Microcoleus asticus IPMA8]
MLEADFTMANLSEAILTQAKLQKAKFQKANFRQVNLSGMNLTNANLEQAKLDSTELKYACLRGANLERANLRYSNLIGANLIEANLRRADFTRCNSYGWNIKNADLTGAIMPDGEIYQPETSDGELYQPETSEKLSQKVTSMTRKIIRTDKAPAPVGPYNQAIAATGTMLFVAGQIAIDIRLNDIVYTDDVAKQTEQVMANLEAILTEAGATWLDVVKTTVFLKDMNDFAAVNAVYAKYFDAETAPARACVEVSRLPKDVLVEIDCIAVI